MNKRVPVSTCPKCGYVTDCARSVTGDAAPTPGNLSICFKCAHVTKFADDLSLVELERDELIALSLDRDFLRLHRRAQAGIESVWRVDGAR